MIDPLTRWAQHGEKPDFTGLLSFAGRRREEGTR
jgi:agmatinase